MRATKFGLDTFENEFFEGYTRDEEWNGWACPYFTFEQAQSIVEAHHRRGMSARYDINLDQFVFIPGGGDEEIYAPVEIDSQKLYPIGAFNWIWEEVAKE